MTGRGLARVAARALWSMHTANMMSNSTHSLLRNWLCGSVLIRPHLVEHSTRGLSSCCLVVLSPLCSVCTRTHSCFFGCSMMMLSLSSPLIRCMKSLHHRPSKLSCCQAKSHFCPGFNSPVLGHLKGRMTVSLSDLHLYILLRTKKRCPCVLRSTLRTTSWSRHGLARHSYH